jgi:hypothetical protein
MRLYTISDSAIFLDSVQAENSTAFLKDLDRDSIPEFIANDLHFLWWKTWKTESPRPLLVWKWDGNRFKLANYRFRDFIIEFHSRWVNFSELPKIDSSMTSGYDRNDEIPVFPPPELAIVMLAYIYAGRPQMADSIFDSYWQDTIPGKDAYYRDFHQQLDSNPIWPELQQSNW